MVAAVAVTRGGKLGDGNGVVALALSGPVPGPEPGAGAGAGKGSGEGDRWGGGLFKDGLRDLERW